MKNAKKFDFKKNLILTFPCLRCIIQTTYLTISIYIYIDLKSQQKEGNIHGV